MGKSGNIGRGRELDAMRSVMDRNRRGWELSKNEHSTKIDATVIDQETCIPTDIILVRADRTIILSAPSNHLYHESTSTKKPIDWEQYVATLPDWEKTLIKTTREIESTRGLYEELSDTNGQILIVSNGGPERRERQFRMNHRHTARNLMGRAGQRSRPTEYSSQSRGMR